MSDYARIEQAMTFMARQGNRQPSLEAIAAQVHLSPWHFQRLFCQWAGTTPKRFLQALTVARSEQLIHQGQDLARVADAVGLSGPSRLYDHFVHLEAATPGDFKREGDGLAITHGQHDTPFGPLFVAMTSRGICRMAFTDTDGPDPTLQELRHRWPKAHFQHQPEVTQAVVQRLLSPPADRPDQPLSLLVQGTNFQVAVWRALLSIPPGTLVSYGQLASALGRPGAARAVGSAVGANPLALVIPCHRVIQQSGALGGYRWGPARKQMIQLWEQCQEGL